MSLKIWSTFALAFVFVCFIGSQAQAFVPLDEPVIIAPYQSPWTVSPSLRAVLRDAEDAVIQPAAVQQSASAQHLRKISTPATPAPAQGGDVFYWLRVASQRHGMSYGYLLSTARCESGLKPTARKGSHLGIFQQASSYWQERVSDYNRHNADKVSGNIYSVRDNILVSAWMMSSPSYGVKHWQCRGSRVVK